MWVWWVGAESLTRRGTLKGKLERGRGKREKAKATMRHNILDRMNPYPPFLAR